MGAPLPRPVPGHDEQPAGGGGAWRGIAASFRVAWDGVVETALQQRNMRIHLVAGVLVGVLGSSVAFGTAERLALLFCVFLVLAAEVANSALEALVDLVVPERHELARKAKDAGAGAVLVLATGAVAVLVTVLLRARDQIVIARALQSRPVLAGVPLAVATAVLLVPFPRARTVDIGVACAGAVLLGLVATGTADVVFTAVSAALFLCAAAVALRRSRRARPPPSP